MSDTVKLIIEIPKKTIAHIRSEYGHGYKVIYDTDKDKIVDAIYHGTPLDDVKAEIDYERNRYLNLVGDSGYCNGLNKALKIIDKCMDKADFPQAKDIEPTVKSFSKVLDNKLIKEAIDE